MVIVCLVIIVSCSTLAPKMGSLVLRDNGKELFSESARWDKNTKFVIVSSHYNEDLSWLKRSPYPVVVCSKSLTPAALAFDTRCSTTVNKGFEASAYLRFIVEYYNRLPQNVVFIHGHEKDWHQNLDILKAIECADMETYGFVSINNSLMLDDARWGEPIVRDWYDGATKKLWEDVLKPVLGFDLPPHSMRIDCCAQFVVSRNRIKRLSRDVYRSLLQYILDSSENDKSIAIAFEYTWHAIFGEPVNIDVSSEKEYLKTRFSKCRAEEVMSSPRK